MPEPMPTTPEPSAATCPKRLPESKRAEVEFLLNAHDKRHARGWNAVQLIEQHSLLCDALLDERTERDALATQVAALRADVARLAEKPKRFPLQGYGLGTIPWSVAARAWEVYDRKWRCGQSLERLAERHGFHVGEMDEFFPGWRDEVERIDGLASKVAALESALAARGTDSILRDALADNATELEALLSKVCGVPEGSRLIDEWRELVEQALAASVPVAVAERACEIAHKMCDVLREYQGKPIEEIAEKAAKRIDDGCMDFGGRFASGLIMEAALARARAEHEAAQSKGAPDAK